MERPNHEQTMTRPTDAPADAGTLLARQIVGLTDPLVAGQLGQPHGAARVQFLRRDRHLGTEKAQQLYLAIQNYLADNGVEMLFSTECENIILENEECKGVLLRQGNTDW